MPNSHNDQDEDALCQYNEMAGVRESYWIGDFTEPVRFPNTGNKWKFHKIFSECQLHEFYIAEASALCVATQIEGPSPGLQGIGKIRMQRIPHGLKSPSWMDPTEDYTWKEKTQLGDLSEKELRNLKRLTRLGSTCTPELLDYFCEQQAEGDYVPKGFTLYMVMEKIPGRNLMNFGHFSIEERDQVRIAFAPTIRQYAQLGYRHHDAHPRNLIWDRKNGRVFIVDLEGAYRTRPYEPGMPAFVEWHLYSADIHSSDGLVDPMVVDMKIQGIKVLLQEDLIAVAEGAKGKKPSKRLLELLDI